MEAGEYYGSWTAADLIRVANRWLIPQPAPVVRLRAVPPIAANGVPTIALPKGQAEAMRCLANNPHASNYDVGVLLGIGTDAAKDRLLRAYRLMRVHSRTEAITLVASGKVRIVDKPRYSRGKDAS